MPPPQLIVETQDAADEAGAQIERRLDPLGVHRVRRPAQDDFAIERRERGRRSGQPLAESFVPFVTSDDVGDDADRAAAVAQPDVLERPPQFFGGTARRDDDRAQARGKRIDGNRRRDGALEGPEIGGAKQPGDARSNHDQRGAWIAGAGGCVSCWSSSMARSKNMSAPDAADAASHAWFI